MTGKNRISQVTMVRCRTFCGLRDWRSWFDNQNHVRCSWSLIKTCSVAQVVLFCRMAPYGCCWDLAVGHPECVLTNYVSLLSVVVPCVNWKVEWSNHLILHIGWAKMVTISQAGLGFVFQACTHNKFIVQLRLQGSMWFSFSRRHPGIRSRIPGWWNNFWATPWGGDSIYVQWC